MSAHLTDDQLLDRLYGIFTDDGTHLDACPECQTRLSQMEQLRAQDAAPPALSDEYFRRQRHRIQDRFAVSPGLFRAIWVPAALALALVAGLALTRPATETDMPAPSWETAAEIIEAGWFEDTYAATREMEPRAVSPIRELFMEGSALE